LKLNQTAKNAINIALLCSLSYLAVYCAKDTLGAVTPQIIADGTASQSDIGTYSSTYFICYAAGQLINGMVGDKIKARYMMCSGMVCSAVSIFVFSSCMGIPWAARIAYGMSGYFLSMIFGPLTKLVAENTDPIYTPRCNLAYTFAAYLGAPLAGLAASLMAWKTVYNTAVSFLLVMGVVCYMIFLAFEKKGIIRYGRFDQTEKTAAKTNATEKIQTLLQHRIAKFALAAMITGVVRTAVVFWMPTYISQALGFDPARAASIFAAASCVLSLNTFLAVFAYEHLKRNMDLTMRLAFGGSAAMFLLVYAVKHPTFNILFLVTAVLLSNSAASIIWAKYCPSLRNTGLVSSASGFLNFCSYIAASAASKIFGDAVARIGWGNLILVWMGLMVLGLLLMLSGKKHPASEDL